MEKSIMQAMKDRYVELMGEARRLEKAMAALEPTGASAGATAPKKRGRPKKTAPVQTSSGLGLSDQDRAAE